IRLDLVNTAMNLSISLNVYAFFFFFFSSRRRHTRFSRDWSSDVCSSDLGSPRASRSAIACLREARRIWRRSPKRRGSSNRRRCRSEERRVGKESRVRWEWHSEKKKKTYGH